MFAGWHATSDDYDVVGDRRRDLIPGGGPMFGLRFGVRLSEAFGLELESGAVAAAVGDETAWLVPARLSFQWRPLSETVTPVLALGGGVIANAAGPGSGDLDAVF